MDKYFVPRGSQTQRAEKFLKEITREFLSGHPIIVLIQNRACYYTDQASAQGWFLGWGWGGQNGWVGPGHTPPSSLLGFFCFLEVSLIYIGLTLVLPYNRPPACFGFFLLVSFLSPVYFQRFFFDNVSCSLFVFLLPSNISFHDSVVVRHYLSAFTGAGQHFLQEPYFRANTNIQITKLNNSIIKRLEKNKFRVICWLHVYFRSGIPKYLRKISALSA